MKETKPWCQLEGRELEGKAIGLKMHPLGGWVGASVAGPRLAVNLGIMLAEPLLWIWEMCENSLGIP